MYIRGCGFVAATAIVLAAEHVVTVVNVSTEIFTTVDSCVFRVMKF